MTDRTGCVIADAIAREIEDHQFQKAPRHFALPATTESDRSQLVAEMWGDMARGGPLWSNIRLFHEGRDLHPSRFMQGKIGDGLIVNSTVDSRAVARYINAGATLIYNHLHESSYAVQRIQEILEYRVGARVTIQSYLTKVDETAFGVHSDDHNFVALQLLGVKSWEVESEASGTTRRLMRPGDGAFLRSGAEHSVSGVGELSLHLNIAFDWLSETAEQPGSTIPDHELDAHHKAYRLGSAVPVAIDPSTLLPTMGLRFAGRVRPDVRVETDKVVLTCAAGQFRLDRRLAPVLEMLCSGREHNVLELADGSGLGAAHVETFVIFAVGKNVLLCGS